MTTPPIPKTRPGSLRGPSLLGLAAALCLAACGGSPEPASEEGSAAPPQSAPAETAASREAPEPSGCPDLGGPTESFDAAGTPLAFAFRHPAGFGVTKQQDMETIYQLDMRRDVEVDGRQRQVYLSFIQGLREQESPVPLEVKMARERPDSPRVKAMGELMPQPAGEIEFGGKAVELFRIDTESKTVYKFHLPHGGGFLSVNAEFAPSGGAPECREEMRRVAAEVVGTVTPAAAGL